MNIRERIDLLEALSEIEQAIDAASDIEWEPGEQQLVDIGVTTRDDKLFVTSALGIPPAVLIAGLRAMEAELSKLAGVPQKESECSTI